MRGACGLAEDSYPHTSKVGPHGAVVRSGPGKPFYATEELQAGDAVEVWRRDSNGWLAIRPPEASYSFVKSDQVRRIPQTDLIEVCVDNAVAWVGSNVGHEGDHKWQVRLSRGEKLVPRGEHQLQLHTTCPAEAYFRIAPPAGEFRWVHANDLADFETEPDRVESDREQADADTAFEPAKADPGIRLADYQVVTDEQPRAEKASPSRDGFVARKGTGNSKSSVAGAGASQSTRTTTANQTSARSSAAKSSAFDERLRDIQLRLSLMAVRSPNEWDFSALRDETDRLVERGANTLERTRAQQVLEQIDEFEGLRERFLQFGETAASSPTANPAGSSSTDPLVDPRFDGTGWLLPVHSTQRSAPPYALLDRDGRIIQFVSPSPGLNLHRYLRKEIGVYGQRSFIPSLDKPHVTAQRVIELDRHRR